MANLVDWIKEVVKTEEIESVVIGRMGWGGGPNPIHDYGAQNFPNYEKLPFGEVLSWETARPYLDREFDCGFGAPECTAIYLWTIGLVLFVSQYDGSTSLESVPRNPTAGLPKMPGG